MIGNYCESCASTLTEDEVITCDRCAVDQQRILLQSDAWMVRRGCVPGELPGETLADTLFRELTFLENQEHREAA